MWRTLTSLFGEDVFGRLWLEMVTGSNNGEVDWDWSDGSQPAMLFVLLTLVVLMFSPSPQQ